MYFVLASVLCGKGLQICVLPEKDTFLSDNNQNPLPPTVLN